MNRNLLLAGGGILIAGGLAYWYLSQQNGNGPPPPPPPQHGCTGECWYEGQTDCDRDNNLCICRNGQWQLSQENSPICRVGIKHNACLKSVNNIITCVPTMGTAPDQCDEVGFSTGCSCATAQCDVQHFCEERVYRCILDRGTNISADNSNWDACESTPDTGWDESGMRCYYTLDNEYVGSSMLGKFGFEWGFPVTNGKLRIYGYLDGVGWNQLGEKGFDVWGTEGEVDITLFFPKQGMSRLLFECVGSSFTNLKPKYFYGTLS